MTTDIKEASFLISSPGVEKCPRTTAPEYAFIGRSNVGKSSLINMLTRRRALALTSATPGKTVLINHYSIDGGAWLLVDLPGYGYARRSKAERGQLSDVIRGYILRRQQLTCLFVLVDSRLEPQRIDLEFIHRLGENGVPFALVFTKADKLTTTALRASIGRYLDTLSEEWNPLPRHFVTSSKDATGRSELLAYIAEINGEQSPA